MYCEEGVLIQAHRDVPIPPISGGLFLAGPGQGWMDGRGKLGS